MEAQVLVMAWRFASTSYSSPRIVPLPAAVPVTLRAVLTMSQSSPSYSLHPTRYRPRRVLLAIILAASYSLSSSPPAPSLTSYSSLRIVQLPPVCHSGAALTMSQSSPFYSSRLSRHHTRRVLLAIILTASYSLLSSPRPTRYRPRRILLAIVLSTGVLIAILSRHAHRVVLIALCSSHCAHRIVSCLPTFLCFRHAEQCYTHQNSVTTCDDRGDGCDTGCLR